MLVVTGCRRSGTSMWMQVLDAAGLPVIGERFPLDWEDALGSANRRGFYESTLRDGIYFATNPNPQTGVYLHPDETHLHAVKVFPQGLVRTDLSFLHRVLVTMRSWRGFAASIDRLLALENEARGWTDAQRPPRLPGVLTWWVENFALVRDIAMRRYRVHIQAYEDVLARPGDVIAPVLAWLVDGLAPDGTLDEAAAIAAVGVPGETSPAPTTEDPDVEPRLLRACDDLYEAVRSGRGLPESLLLDMNGAHEAVRPRFEAHEQAVLRWAAEGGADGIDRELLSL
jgi:hypothetical protein